MPPRRDRRAARGAPVAQATGAGRQLLVVEEVLVVSATVSTNLGEHLVDSERSSAPLYPALAKSTLSNLTIAGCGEPKEDCRNWVPTEFCSGSEMIEGTQHVCGRPHLTRHSCMSRTCPYCWRKWREKRLEKAFKRIVGYDMHTYLERNTGVSAASYGQRGGDKFAFEEKRVVHATVSFKEEDCLDREYSQIRSEAAELASEAGFNGFMLIPHHFRLSDEGINRLASEHDIEGKPSSGWWSLVIEEHPDEWREYTHAGLHFHVIGVTGDRWSGNEKLKEGQNVGGEEHLFKRIRDLDTLSDLKATVSYVLSHATPPEDSHVSTWYGDLAYNQFSPDSLSRVQHDRLCWLFEHDRAGDDEDTECPACGSTCSKPIHRAKELLRRRGTQIEYREELSVAYDWVCSDEYDEVKEVLNLKSKNQVRSVIGLPPPDD